MFIFKYALLKSLTFWPLILAVGCHCFFFLKEWRNSLGSGQGVLIVFFHFEERRNSLGSERNLLTFPLWRRVIVSFFL